MTDTDEHRALKPIRPAASLLVVRERAGVFEVLSLLRSRHMRFLPGHVAFPGGTLDELDWDYAGVPGSGHVVAGEGDDDNAFAIGALRECAEETGNLVALRSPAGRLEEPLTEAMQADLLAGRVHYPQLLARRDAGIALDRLRFVGRWITPADRPARFDTRFFLYICEDSQLPIRVHPDENEWGQWREPAGLLAEIEQGVVAAVPPTRAMLRALAALGSAGAAWTSLHVPGPVR